MKASSTLKIGTGNGFVLHRPETKPVGLLRNLVFTSWVSILIIIRKLPSEDWKTQPMPHQRFQKGF